MDKEYTKRELDEFFQVISRRFDSQDKKLDSIEIQTKKTNGSIYSLKAWRTGITMCIAIIVFIVIPLVVYSFQLSQENIKNDILLQLKK